MLAAPHTAQEKKATGAGYAWDVIVFESNGESCLHAIQFTGVCLGFGLVTSHTV